MKKIITSSRSIRLVLPLILSCFSLTACVTETSGGFNVEPSESRAIEDYLQLSMGYLGQNDLVNTRRHLNNIMELDSNNSVAFGLWGLLYSAEGDYDLAEDSFRRSLRIDPSKSQVRNNFAAFLFARGQYQDAYEQLAIVVEDTNYVARSQAFENMGLAALQLNRSDDAEYAFSRALQLNSNLVRSSIELIDIYLKKDNFAQAKSLFSSYETLLQFYNSTHTARSLWLGIQIEKTVGNAVSVARLSNLLEENFSDSVEYSLHQSSEVEL